MSKNDVIGLLEAGVEPSKVGEAAQLVGITFEMNSQVETELRDAGSDEGLIALLRRIARKDSTATEPQPAPPGSGPAFLLFEVMPGGAQVYVDDEPMGTTSQAGRLKLSHLPPGEHLVRISLAGYADHEERVELKPGESVQVSAELKHPAAPGAVNPPAPGNSATRGGGGPNPLAGGTSSTPEPGSLGVMVASQGPAGRQGAFITAVAPGGPAEQAGLRPGYSILSVNGRAIQAPQNLLAIVTGSHAGDVLQIGYTDGSRIYSTQAHLVPRSRLVPPSQNPIPVAGGATNPGPVLPQFNPRPNLPTVTYSVNHDHGQSGQDYCSGVLVIGGGRISFRSNNPAHSFDYSLDEVKEAKKNSVYLALLGAFHIRMKKGPNYNFVTVNASGQPQSPDELLRNLGMAMGRD